MRNTESRDSWASADRLPMTSFDFIIPNISKYMNCVKNPRCERSREQVAGTPGHWATLRPSLYAPLCGQSAAVNSGRHLGQRVGVAGQKPAPVRLFAVYGD